MTRPVVVTGAGGALGRAVLAVLKDTSHDVISHSGRRDGDLTNAATCRDLVARCTPRAIINTAGRTYGTLRDLWTANLLVPVRLADAIADADVRTRLVLVGSAAEYGLPPLASEAPIGVRDIDSTPPAMTAS